MITITLPRIQSKIQSKLLESPARESIDTQRLVAYLITRWVLTPAGPCGKRARRLLLELPLLATHRTDVTGLLRVQPLHDAVYVKTMRALPPH